MIVPGVSSLLLLFSFFLVCIQSTQELIGTKISTINRFTKELSNLNPFSSSHPLRNLLNHSGGSSSSSSKPSYKPKPSYGAPKPSYKAPGAKKPSYKPGRPGGTGGRKPSYGSSSLQAPSSGGGGVGAYSGNSGVGGGGGGYSESSGSESTLTREELLTLVLQMHSMIHELIEENQESYGTPLGKPINGGSTQSLPTYGIATQALESYGVSNSQPISSFKSQSSLPSYGGTLSQDQASYRGEGQVGQVISSVLPAQSSNTYTSAAVQAPNLYVGPTSGPSSASSGYTGPSSSSFGYSGPSSASSGYSGPSSASSGYSGPSSASSGYNSPTSVNSGSSGIQATYSGTIQQPSSSSSSAQSSSFPASDSYGDPIADPVISSTLDQIVNTLSAYQSNQPGLQSGQTNQGSYQSNIRTRRKNEFVPSPKWYPELEEEEGTEPDDNVITHPQRIRAILAILENRRIDDSSPSYVNKRNIEDILELLDVDLEQDAELLEQAQGVEDQHHQLILESFFKR